MGIALVVLFSFLEETWDPPCQTLAFAMVTGGCRHTSPLGLLGLCLGGTAPGEGPKSMGLKLPAPLLSLSDGPFRSPEIGVCQKSYPMTHHMLLASILGLARRVGCFGYQTGSWPGMGRVCSNGATWGTRAGMVGSYAQAPDGIGSNQAKMEAGNGKAPGMPSTVGGVCQALKGLERSKKTGCLEKGWDLHGPWGLCVLILKDSLDLKKV